jgi:hypothetical protein
VEVALRDPYSMDGLTVDTTLRTQQDQGQLALQEEDGGHHFQGVAIVMLCVVGIGCVVGVAFVVLYCRCCCMRGRRRSSSSSTKSRSLESVEVHSDVRAGEVLTSQYSGGSSNNDSCVIGCQQRSPEDASVWARRMMMASSRSNVSAAAVAVQSGAGREGEAGCLENGHVITIPVEETVYIEQPDGKHTLAVSRRFKDVMVHVVESDLGVGHIRVDVDRQQAGVGLVDSLCGSSSKYFVRALTNDCGGDERITAGEKAGSSGSSKKRKKKKKKKYCDGWCQTML